MKIYTRTGDDGTTGLAGGGGRVAKDDSRLAAYGAIDELNAVLGLCRTAGLPAEIDDVLGRLQHEMFSLGAELASPDPASLRISCLSDGDIERIEQTIDHFEQGLSPLRNFILPGGSPGAAALHMARCTCRRAERDLVTLCTTAPVRSTVLKYVNRVSDLLFVLARACNADAGVNDILWKP